MSTIAIIGATGNAGSELTQEALRRGHQVTAISRRGGAPTQDGVTSKQLDMTESAALAEALTGHDAVFSAAHFTVPPRALIDPVKQSGMKRLMVVGGAGSLYVKPGLMLIDTPEFPAQFKAEAGLGVDYLKALKAETDLDWTFVSPSAFFIPGERTGRFRVGADDLLVDASGKSSITFADFAIAFLDEFEKPSHIRQRFTVGY